MNAPVLERLWDAERIMRDMAQAHGFLVHEIQSKSRTDAIVAARMAIARRLRGELRLSLKRIGRLLHRSPWQCEFYCSSRLRSRHNRRKLRKYHEFQKTIRKRGNWCKTFTVWARAGRS